MQRIFPGGADLVRAESCLLLSFADGDGFKGCSRQKELNVGSQGCKKQQETERLCEGVGVSEAEQVSIVYI